MHRHSILISLFAAYTITSGLGLVLVKWAFSEMRTASPTGALWDGLNFVLCAQVVTGGVLYVVSFGFWMWIVSRAPLSTAYPVAVGLTLVFTTAASIVLLSERIDLMKGLGIVTVIAGVYLVSMSEEENAPGVTSSSQQSANGGRHE